MLGLDWQDKIEIIEGNEANASLLDDSGELVFRYIDGFHRGHVATLYTEKHNCGAYGESITCECESAWQSAMHGCWQRGHQREERGDKSLTKGGWLRWRRVRIVSISRTENGEVGGIVTDMPLGTLALSRGLL